MLDKIKPFLLGGLLVAAMFGAGELVSSQIKIGANPPEAQQDALLKRIIALEAETAQLKKEMAGAKLVVAGLDKNYSSMKKSFDSHTHKIQSLATPAVVDAANRNGSNPLLVVAYGNDVKAKGGFFTGPPADGK